MFLSCPLQLEEGHSRLVLLSPVFLSHNFRLFCCMPLKDFLCLRCESLPSLFWLHRMHIGIVLSFTPTVRPLQWRWVFISMVWQKLFLNTGWRWILYFTFIYIMNLNPNMIPCQDLVREGSIISKCLKARWSQVKTQTLFSVWLDPVMILREFYEVIKYYLLKKSNTVK